MWTSQRPAVGSSDWLGPFMCKHKSLVEGFRNDIAYANQAECDEQKPSGRLRLELPDIFRWIAESALVASKRQRYADDNLARDFQRARQSLGRNSHRDNEACNAERNYRKTAPKYPWLAHRPNENKMSCAGRERAWRRVEVT